MNNKQKIKEEVSYYLENYPKIFNSNYKYSLTLLYVLHLIVTFWQPYVVLTLIFNYKNSFYDKLVIGVLLLIAVHWICIKNECILSVIEKKIINKNYELGSYPSLHPGLFYFMSKNNLFNLYDYTENKKKKLITIVNSYVTPPVAVFYLMWRNKFFGNYELCVFLVILHSIVMIYQVKNDKVLNNFD